MKATFEEVKDSVNKSPVNQIIQGNWKQFKGNLREVWGELTDNELDQSEGQIERIVGLVQERTGENRAEIRKRIDEIASKIKDKV